MDVPILSSPAIVASHELRRGRVLAIDADGAVVVEVGTDLVTCDRLCGSDDVPSRLDVGESVLIAAPPGDSRGVVVGRIATPELVLEQRRRDAASHELPETLVLEARDNLTLRVGDGSITLRADGKILIKGRDLVSHARNLNRIKGGAVAIN